MPAGGARSTCLGLTQVRPDLLVQVSEGALGAGTHYIEFERFAVLPRRVAEKLGPYRRMAATGRPLPLLVVCEMDRGERELQRRRPETADADHHPGAGAGRSGDRRGYGVEPERSAGGAALPVETAEQTCNRSVRDQGPRAKPGSARYPAEVAPVSDTCSRPRAQPLRATRPPGRPAPPRPPSAAWS